MSLWSRLDGCMVQAADECFFYFVFFLPSSQWKCIFYFLHSAIKKEYFPPPCSFLENARGFKKVRQTHTIVLDCKNKMKTPVHMRNLSWYYFDTCAYLTCCLTDFYSSVNIFFFPWQMRLILCELMPEQYTAGYCFIRQYLLPIHFLLQFLWAFFFFLNR